MLPRKLAATIAAVKDPEAVKASAPAITLTKVVKTKNTEEAPDK